MPTHQSKQRDRQQCVGGNVEIKVEEGMDQDRDQPEGASQDKRRFVAPLGREIVLRALDEFPTAENFPKENAPDRRNEQESDQPPVGKSVDIVVMRSTGPILQLV